MYPVCHAHAARLDRRCVGARLPGGGGRLLGLRSVLLNAGVRQPVLALCRLATRRGLVSTSSAVGVAVLFKGTGVCFSLQASQLAAELVRDDLRVAPGHLLRVPTIFFLHASQLAIELVREDLRVAPGHCFDPSADDRVGSRRA